MDGNIKGLVFAGHEMASELKAECGAVDVRSVSQLISDLATQLEVQLVRAEETGREFRSADITMQNLEAKCATLAAKSDASLKAERVWEETMMEVCGEDGPASVANEIRSLQARRDTAMQALKYQVEQLAAENAQLNKFIVQSCYVFNGEQDEISDAYICATDGGMPQTPATDAFLAEIRAEARNEGINYTASRLAAAFNHGFINKSLREVFDVTRMILSAKEELANELHPIDGLSGEYAEKSLEEWAEQIRKGVQS